MGFHSGQSQIFFNDNFEGIDLGNVEIKTCGNKFNMYTLTAKDQQSTHIVFIDERESYFYFVKTKMLKFSNRRGIRLSEIEHKCYLETNNLDEMMQEMEKIVKDKKYLKWLNF
jgi:hypothetical protein